MSNEQWKKRMDALAERIELGIATHGAQVLEEKELAPIWNFLQPESEWEKRMQIENFARHYSFTLSLNDDCSVAIFRRLV
jgi:hypothetical protein